MLRKVFEIWRKRQIEKLVSKTVLDLGVNTCVTWFSRENGVPTLYEDDLETIDALFREKSQEILMLPFIVEYKEYKNFIPYMVLGHNPQACWVEYATIMNVVWEHRTALGGEICWDSYQQNTEKMKSEIEQIYGIVLTEEIRI